MPQLMSPKPIVTDLYTLAHPNLLACTLVAARIRKTKLIVSLEDCMDLIYLLDGTVDDQNSGFTLDLANSLREELRFIRSHVQDETSLSDPRSSLYLLERGREREVVDIRWERDYAPAQAFLTNPRAALQTVSGTIDRGIRDSGLMEILLDRTLTPRAERERYWHRLERLYRAVTIPRGFLRQFSGPVSFNRTNVRWSCIRSLGVMLLDDADVMTANEGWYAWLRKQCFRPVNVNRRVRISAFAEALKSAPATTSVADVVHAIDNVHEWESFNKLASRMNAARDTREDLVVYVLSEAAGVLAGPLRWLVKLGHFLVRIQRGGG